MSLQHIARLPTPEFGAYSQMQLPKFNRGLSIANAFVSAGQSFIGGLSDDQIGKADKAIGNFFGFGKG